MSGGLLLERRPLEGRGKKNMMTVISMGSAPISFMPASTGKWIGDIEHRSELHARAQRTVIWHRASAKVHSQSHSGARQGKPETAPGPPPCGTHGCPCGRAPRRSSSQKKASDRGLLGEHVEGVACKAVTRALLLFPFIPKTIEGHENRVGTLALNRKWQGPVCGMQEETEDTHLHHRGLRCTSGRLTPC